MNDGDAALALHALGWILTDEPRAERLLGMTGLSPEGLRAALGEVHIDPVGLTRDDWLDLLMTHRIQPGFDDSVMTVVHDWPASQAALARIRPGSPALAERFELYLGTVELANGYHELNDADEQRARFLRDRQRRHAQ